MYKKPLSCVDNNHLIVADKTILCSTHNRGHSISIYLATEDDAKYTGKMWNHYHIQILGQIREYVAPSILTYEEWKSKTPVALLRAEYRKAGLDDEEATGDNYTAYYLRLQEMYDEYVRCCNDQTVNFKLKY
jgi:hypothetical protein